ncbi:MAG: T9SS type A sorting domain-containing protein [Dysgonamonadaceae bacterium]|jgi:hypothetical protein|nr:T9SS type A sorting domain-containing protein [Dysgonamonadaceae bacterium]
MRITDSHPLVAETYHLIDKISVFNIKGSLVYQSANGLNKYDHTVNTSNWAKGVYVARIHICFGR